jgi:tol-pal system protein YbgF
LPLSLLLLGGCLTKQGLMMPWTAEHRGIERKLDSLALRMAELESTQQWSCLEMRAELGNQNAATNDRIEVLGAKLDDYVARLSRLAQRTAKPPQESAPAKTSVDSTAPYRTAYQDYVVGKYDLAVQGFQSFLKAFPTSDLADNAQYWLGECYSDLKQYEAAISEFQKVIDNYPESDKVAGALYKQGQCLEQLGENGKAIEKYQVVVQKYSFSQEAKLAEEALRRLKK